MKKSYFIYIGILILGFALGYFNPEEKIDFLFTKAGTKNSVKIGSWFTNLGIAANDQAMMTRAVIARIGLGANTKEEAIYLTARLDADGQPLNSSNEYEIIFNKDLPVTNFWSLTVYGSDDYLIDNPDNKYAVASTDALIKKEDGTLTILVSKDIPLNRINWIPAPKEAQPMTLTLRCYNPKQEMLANIQGVEFPTIKKVGG